MVHSILEILTGGDPEPQSGGSPMAEVSHTETSNIGHGLSRITWSAVTEADTFEAFTFTSPPTVLDMQVTGTLGGATVTAEASIDGTNYDPVRRSDGTSITFAAVGMEALPIRPVAIQPTHSSGTSESVTVSVVYGY